MQMALADHLARCLEHMQMALMDYHVAEAHADGADGLPRG
jgi:hypothetical protein